MIPLSQLANLEPGSYVDTIGICKSFRAVQSGTSKKTKKKYEKRELTLVDSSNTAVTLTLWGDYAVNFDGSAQPVILVKGARVNTYKGVKGLEKAYKTAVQINPNIAEGHKLRDWFDNGGGGTEWLTFREARDRKLGAGDKPDYFQCTAVADFVESQNAFYKACPQQDCNKKVTDENNGRYRCERCNKVFTKFKYGLLIKMRIGDWTSNRRVTCFSEVGEQMLKRSAQEIGDLLENNPPEGEEVLYSIFFKPYIFKLRSKMEMFNGKKRNELTVQSAAPLDYKDYNKYLINNLKKLTGINKI